MRRHQFAFGDGDVAVQQALKPELGAAGLADAAVGMVDIAVDMGAEPLDDISVVLETAAVGRHVLAGQVLFTDDIPVKVLALGTGKTATGRA